MAPRRTAARTAVVEAAAFNFEEFLAGFERPEFTRQLFGKGKLGERLRSHVLPELDRVEAELDELTGKIEKLQEVEDEGGAERDITAVNPLAVLSERQKFLADELKAKTSEYNTLAQEYNASAVDFTFRVPDDEDDKARIDELMEADGAVQPDRPDVEGMDDAAAEPVIAEYNKAFSHWWDALMLCSMSVTCVSHDLTVAQWKALRTKVGLAGFNALSEAWAEAVQAAKPQAPFLQRSSPTLTTDDQ